MMNLFKIYIKEHIKVLAAFLLFFCVLTVSFFLYHLPVEAVVYQTLL